MAIQMTLPLMGEGVVEATIANWLKNEGEPVAVNEPIVEVETDKVTTEIVADGAGLLLKIVAQAGETVAVGAVLAWIGQAGESLDAAEAQAAPPQKAVAATVSTTDATNGSRAVALPTHKSEPNKPVSTTYTGRISPVVARMVKEHNLNLDLIAGTGKAGRITKRDVDAYLKTETTPPPPEKIEPTPAAPQTVPLPAQDRSPAGELLPHSSMRRRIAEHMLLSKATSPHATTVFEVDYSDVKDHRQAHKADYAKRGVNLTYTAYLAAAVLKGLIAVPKVNSAWRDDGLFLHHAVHLGIATAIKNGLVVPIIRHAERLNLLGLAQAVGEMAEKGRQNRLQPTDLQGGTFTITNHGVFGSQFATPIINQPQAGILGVGVIEDRVCAIDGMVAVRLRGYLSFSFDHRILDGADADRFMGVVKETIEGKWE